MTKRRRERLAARRAIIECLSKAIGCRDVVNIICDMLSPCKCGKTLSMPKRYCDGCYERVLLCNACRQDYINDARCAVCDIVHTDRCHACSRSRRCRQCSETVCSVNFCASGNMCTSCCDGDEDHGW